ncbi:Beta LACTamase domain containing family member [Fasciola hepatica]|uniref:Beta LACTamase domain containing family member n=1 Tax=Fasciola hepatica TaxID=6192 RepID=A0A4E0RF88_FASHE|nr:Beta LACTamase domain containing family member [Fasciola hepatica]
MYYIHSGFGFADVEQLVHVHANTVFRIASISKSFTSLLVGRLLDQHKLAVDDDVRTYVPEFPKKLIDGKYAKIPIRTLLNHTSGIRSYHKENSGTGQAAYPEMLLNKRFDSPLEACRLFQDDPLAHSPGQKYLYSTYAFTLLSAAIERVSTQNGPIFPLPTEPAEDVKTTADSIPKWARIDTQLCRLFQFLGLRSTSLEYHEKLTPFRCKQYRRTTNGVLENTPVVDNSYKWAGGGILSTAPDLIRVANHLASIYMGRLHSHGVVTRDTLTQLWHAYPVNSKGVWQPGLGWFLSRRSGGSISEANICPDRLYVLHTGGAVGSTTALLLSLPCCSNAGTVRPEHGDPEEFTAAISLAPPICVAVLTNLEDSSEISQLAVSLAEVFTEDAVRSVRLNYADHFM